MALSIKFYYNSDGIIKINLLLFKRVMFKYSKIQRRLKRGYSKKPATYFCNLSKPNGHTWFYLKIKCIYNYIFIVRSVCDGTIVFCCLCIRSVYEGLGRLKVSKKRKWRRNGPTLKHSFSPTTALNLDFSSPY